MDDEVFLPLNGTKNEDSPTDKKHTDPLTHTVLSTLNLQEDMVDRNVNVF